MICNISAKNLKFPKYILTFYFVKLPIITTKRFRTMGPRLCLATALETTNVVYWSTVVKFLASEVMYSCSVVIFLRHAFILKFGKIVLSLRFCEYTKTPFVQF